MPARSGATIGITSSTCILWLAAPWFLEPAQFWTSVVLLFALSGLLRPSISANLSIIGIRFLGPTLASTFAATTPIFGACIGILFLDETLTWPIALGTMGIMLAVMILSKRKKEPAGSAVKTWPLWAILFPLGAACLRSVAHVMIKVGMLEVPDPYFAALVAFTTSSIVMLSLQWRQGMEALTLSNPGFKYFVGAGLVFSAAVLLLNIALLKGDIVVVIPMISAIPIFSMLLSIVVFRVEKITLRTVLVLALIVPSVAAVGVFGKL